jgi:hypothetical protein
VNIGIPGSLGHLHHITLNGAGKYVLDIVKLPPERGSIAGWHGSVLAQHPGQDLAASSQNFFNLFLHESRDGSLARRNGVEVVKQRLIFNGKQRGGGGGGYGGEVVPIA